VLLAAVDRISVAAAAAAADASAAASASARSRSALVRLERSLVICSRTARKTPSTHGQTVT